MCPLPDHQTYGSRIWKGSNPIGIPERHRIVGGLTVEPFDATNLCVARMASPAIACHALLRHLTGWDLLA